MFCRKCGIRVDDSFKYCPNCGETLKTKKEYKTGILKCKICGGIMNIDDENPVLYCPYCGSKELILERDNVTIERVKNKTKRDIEYKKIDLEREKLEIEREEAEKRLEEQKAQAFKKGTFSKIIIGFIVLAVLCVVTAVHDGKILASIIGVVQIVLLVTAWLFGARILKNKIPGIHIVCVIIAFLLSSPFLIYFNKPSLKEKIEETKQIESKKYEWPDNGLLAMLPPPKSKNGEISYNDSDKGFLYVYKTSLEDYQEYIKKCESKGFSIDIDESDNFFNAYDSGDNELKIQYYTNEEEMTIGISAPIKMAEYRLPNNKLVKKIPKPKSKIGKISIDESDYFTIYVGDITAEEYKDYVDKCIKKGFDVDYSRGDTYFSGNNSAGDELSVSLNRKNIMYISLMARDYWD